MANANANAEGSATALPELGSGELKMTHITDFFLTFARPVESFSLAWTINKDI